jgi:hypothetical protein
MQAPRKDRHILMLVAVVVAVVGQAVVLFGDFAPGNASQDSAKITAAAVARAGAIEIPSGSPATRPG